MIPNQDKNFSCLFCPSNGPFNTTEHIIPESLGNDDLTLENHVCDKCQNYFGKEIEQFVLNKSPIAAWRAILGTTTKKGKRPKIDLSQPRKDKGVLPAISRHHDDIELLCRDDESVEITKISNDLITKIKNGECSRFNFVITPKVLYMLGRFLCKVGLELICMDNPTEARSDKYNAAREYARQGPWNPLWPILWYQSGSVDSLKEFFHNDSGIFVKAQCYSYWLADVHEHRFFELGIGTDRFTIALTEALCPILLEAQIANPEYTVLWYPPESISKPQSNS